MKKYTQKIIQVAFIVCVICLWMLYRNDTDELKDIIENGIECQAAIIDVTFVKNSWKTQVAYHYNGINYNKSGFTRIKHQIGDTITIKFKKADKRIVIMDDGINNNYLPSDHQ